MTTFILIIILIVIASALILSNYQKMHRMETIKKRQIDKKNKWEAETDTAVLGEMEEIRKHLIEALESRYSGDEDQIKKMKSLINEVLSKEQESWEGRRSWIRNPNQIK